MGENLLSVGIDVGTSTTQLIVSRLEVVNRACTYSVPDFSIGKREIVYESPVYFTPLKSDTELDAPRIRDIVAREYHMAGVQPEEVKTGAIIITGETARKENAKEVLESLKEFAGHFVVATAGPDLESVLAARGAGAVRYSEKTGKTLLHMDIGGGTSNMALIEKGTITATGCLNVGGRLIRIEQGKITYVSPVLAGLTDLTVGDPVTEKDLMPVLDVLVEALETGSGLKTGDVPESLVTNKKLCLPPGEVVFSFSGGVGDLMGKNEGAPFRYGDIGPLLADRIRESDLWKGSHYLPEQTIRATVIGAGCHSTQLSGSTVYGKDVQLPLENLPVLTLNPEKNLKEQVENQKERWEEGPLTLYHPGIHSPSFEEVQDLAQKLCSALALLPRPWVVVTGEDMAKALGQVLQALAPGSLLCLDGLRLESESFLDVGSPIGGGAAYPVVKKTLILG